MNKPTFEESIELIDREILKRKSKWNLTSIAWMDFSDVSQIIRIHIAKKWHLFDPKQSLAPWINRIITHQIRNLVRNNYSAYSRPCLKCASAQGETLCAEYGEQCAACPLYAEWLKRKKTAYDTKLPVSLENHAQEVYDLSTNSIDIERTALGLHQKMKEHLRPTEWQVYDLLYIQDKTEEEVAQIMGFKTSEIGKKRGYKRIKEIKTTVLKKARELLRNDEIDMIP